MSSRKRTRSQSAKPMPGFCRNGHKRTKANTYHAPNGNRQCHTCKIVADRYYRKKNREICNARVSIHYWKNKETVS